MISGGSGGDFENTVLLVVFLILVVVSHVCFGVCCVWCVMLIQYGPCNRFAIAVTYPPLDGGTAVDRPAPLRMFYTGSGLVRGLIAMQVGRVDIEEVNKAEQAQSQVDPSPTCAPARPVPYAAAPSFQSGVKMYAEGRLGVCASALD